MKYHEKYKFVWYSDYPEDYDDEEEPVRHVRYLETKTAVREVYAQAEEMHGYDYELYVRTNVGYVLTSLGGIANGS